MKKLIVIAGAGEYPRLLVEGAKRAGVETVDVMAVKGSCERATARAADHVFPFAVGESEVAIRWTAEHGYDGAVLAGQVSPLSLFRGKFGPVVDGWGDSLHGVHCRGNGQDECGTDCDQDVFHCSLRGFYLHVI